MTDEQILQLVKEHFEEWEADEDGFDEKRWQGFKAGYEFAYEEKEAFVKAQQKEKAKKLALDLRDWSQNEEMIDQYFTKHGIICNEAAELLEKISDG